MYRYCVLMALVALLALGCSSEKEAKVYDTKTNPQDFPPDAVKLLDDVESEKLVTLDEISEAFADLYTNNSSLLDNAAWRGVIDRLGVRLGVKANNLAAEGPTGYKRAADYYALASFARPDDSALAQMQRLFRPMMQLADQLPDPSFWAAYPPEGRVAIMKRFYVEGIDGRQFADRYLKDYLFKDNDPALDRLNLLDRAFLAAAGVRELQSDTALIRFEEPRLDLTAMNISPLDTNISLAEFYFKVYERPDADFTIAFRLFSADSSDTSGGSNRVTAFDFDPEPITTDWSAGTVVLACRTIPFSGRVDGVTFGLMDRQAQPLRYVKAEGSDQNLYQLRMTVGQAE